MISMDRVDSMRRKCRRGEPVAAIARELGVSRDTVHKHARTEDLSPEPPKARKGRPSKMDGWAPLVDQWLTDDFRENRKQRHTAHRVWRRLVDECGADVSEQTVRRYVREARLRLGGGPSCLLGLDWPAGVAQVDFGHAAFVAGGTRREMPFFVASFPYSNVWLAQVFPGENAECASQGPGNVFEFVGGVPTRVVFDNATGVGRRVCDGVRTTRLFEACSAHYGFEYRFRDPYSGHEEGSAGNKVGTQRRNLFVPVPRVWDVDGHDERLPGRSRDMSRKEHHGRGRPASPSTTASRGWLPMGRAARSTIDGELAANARRLSMSGGVAGGFRDGATAAEVRVANRLLSAELESRDVHRGGSASCAGPGSPRPSRSRVTTARGWPSPTAAGRPTSNRPPSWTPPAASCSAAGPGGARPTSRRRWAYGPS